MIWTPWLGAILIWAITFLCFHLYMNWKYYRHFSKYALIYVFVFGSVGIYFGYKHDQIEDKEMNRRSEIMKPCQSKCDSILNVCREKL